MKTLIAMSVLVSLVACSGDSPNNASEGPVDVSSRAATQAECPYGGYVLSVDAQNIPVCDGKNGVDGKSGAVGATGPTGVKGATGAASTTMLNTVTVHTCPFTNANFITLATYETVDNVVTGTFTVFDIAAGLPFSGPCVGISTNLLCIAAVITGSGAIAINQSGAVTQGNTSLGTSACTSSLIN